MDGLAAATSESAPCTEPLNKTNIPCYFYFNGYCSKGDKCSFLHSIEADAPAVRNSLKPTVAKSEVSQLENNAFAGIEAGLAPTNEHLNPPATVNVAVDTKLQSDKDFQPSELNDMEHERGSPQISVSDCEGTATVRSDSLIPTRRSVQSVSYESEEHSSGEQVDDQIGSEERWESSPGFDVLVDGDAENLDFEEDQEFILGLDRGRQDLNSHFLGSEFENPVEYDLKYHDTEPYYESTPYKRRVNDHIFDDTRNIPGHAKVTMLDSILCRKRKLLPMELDDGNHRDVDLRDQLRRRRFIDSHSVTRFSRMQESSRMIGRSDDRPQWHGIGRRRPHGRLASEVGRNTIESFGNDENYRNGGRPRGLNRNSQRYRPRKHFKEKRPPKRQFISSEVSRKKAPRERRSAQKSSTFTGPKTLAQLREEKKKAESNGDSIGIMGHSSRRTFIDFRGPLPLSEILKEKGKLACESEAPNQ